MRTLAEVVKDKLYSLCCPYNPRESLLGQLMISVFNEETPDDLPLNMYDRNDMEQEVCTLLYCSDAEVFRKLHLTSPESHQELAQKLDEAKTIEEVTDLLIMDILWNMMSEQYDGFPHFPVSLS